MSDKLVTLKQGKIIYKLGGGMGSWAKSTESTSPPIGTTRVIGEILMKAYTVYSNAFNYDINWTPVDESHNTPENLRAWIIK